jgi:hypothetical protein
MQRFKHSFHACRPGFRGAGDWRGLIKLAGVLLLALAWLPSLIAGLITVGDVGGEHEFRCAATRDGFEVTLHHSRVSHHHHTLVERMLIGAADDGEPDHHLRFSLSDRFSELAEIEMPPPAADPSWRETLVSLPEPVAAKTTTIPWAGPWRAPPPPWRGVVMTV